MEPIELQKIAETWTITNVLSRQAEQSPLSPALQWQDEAPYTYKELYQYALRVAGGLRSLGVKPTDKVLFMLPNSLEILFSWFGTNLLGAIQVPINIHYKGSFLIHEVNDCAATVAIVHNQFVERFIEVEKELKYIEKIIVVGEGQDRFSFSKWDYHTWTELIKGEPLTELPELHYSDTAAIMYTSGTTGPSKGVEMPYGLCGVFAQEVVEVAQMTSEDTYYVCLPLFHANAQFMQVLPALLVGAKVSVWPRFSASQWLSQIRACGATLTNTLGVMCEFIYRQPEKGDDGVNPLRAMITLPAPQDIAEAFESRFNVLCLEGYGLTETSVFTYRHLNEPLRLGSAGKPMKKWFEVRIVNELDEVVPPNEVGEIVVRPKIPWTIMKGYHNVPKQTLEAWRNLWFHTGDMGKMDEEGYLYFVDRIKDAIRRRGENISSHSIESVVNLHPLVEESAAVAVPAEYGAGGEDEVKVCVVLKEGAQLDPASLYEYCVQNMPYFAVPRFIEFFNELPKTSNQKIRKVVLRDQGVNSRTWDRESQGITLTNNS